MTTFIGTNGDDSIVGGNGDDVINARGGDDRVAGRLGNDLAFLGAGTDSFVWAPGDGDDTVSGGGGQDTLIFLGSDDDELMTATTKGANGTHQFFRDLGDITIDSTRVELIDARALGGDDDVDGSDQTDPLVRLDIAGGDGDDTLTGGAGNDTLRGGNGDDLVVGGLGNDVGALGAGRDTFVWEPGDGDDTVNGGTEADELVFNGSDDAEVMTVTTQGSNGTHQFFRDLGDITVDSTRVERIETDARGGDDLYDASAQTDPLVRLSVDGGAGNDTIIGGAGRDTLSGGDGRDRLEGGAGADLLSGDGGRDVFDYDAIAAGRDSIAGFAQGADRIDLDTIDADTGDLNNQDFIFIGSDPFSDAGQVRAVDVSQGTLVQASTDLDQAAELQILLDDQVPLSSSDFLL